ncbi:MAG: DUF1697 domain-containing protein [Streptomycetaceae bacterium]|nr:DUF1697 domain-containing protein [Streptomycetaceae bacterium]
MTRFVALLRGINVGGKNKIPMAELRAMLGGLGYTDVATLLQSGNAVFGAGAAEPAAVSAAVEAAITETFGGTIRVMVRTGAEMRAVVDANPLDVGHPSKFLVTFFAEPVDTAKLADVDVAAYPPDEMAVIGREIYYNLPRGINEAKLPLVVERKLKGGGTARNWNTVTKLALMADED